MSHYKKWSQADKEELKTLTTKAEIKKYAKEKLQALIDDKVSLEQAMAQAKAEIAVAVLAAPKAPLLHDSEREQIALAQRADQLKKQIEELEGRGLFRAKIALTQLENMTSASTFAAFPDLYERLGRVSLESALGRVLRAGIFD
jgi:uncharacterized membrane protein YgaE (UPF0421/DUF939 family)